MARRIAAATLVLLLGGTPALAQVTTGTGITITETNDQDLKINIAECQNATPDALTFNWTVSNFTVSGTYTLLASDQSGCPDTTTSSTAHSFSLGDVTASSASGAWPPGGTLPYNVAQLLNNLNVSCTGTATAVYFCVDYTPSAGAVITNAATATLALDLARPPAPSITSVTQGDGALNVNWTAGSTTTSGTTLGTSSSYDIVATSDADPNQHTKTITGGTSGRIDGLTNGVTYSVVVYAVSPGGNRSDASAAASGTPVEVQDFWRLYRAAGGKEQGCGSGAAGAVAILTLIPFALRRRRR